MRRKRRLNTLLPLLLINSVQGWNFNFGTFGKDEQILLFNDFGRDFDPESPLIVGLWKLNEGPSLSRKASNWLLLV